MERALRQIVRRATRVITVSEHSRTAWLELTGMDPARVDVTPLAAGPEFQPRNAAACGAALQRHRLEFQRYLLFVGTIEPRKNIPTLLDAYAMLPAGLRKRHPLVLVGHPGWRSDDVHARLRALSSRGEVRYLGYLPADEVPHLTSGALALVLPSHDEGFGLPVVEAMASGVPVVCSDAASLPEVAGDVALMAPAEDASAFARQLQRALEDAAWREEAGRRGLERAATLSWPATTSLTVAAYQRAVTATGGL
jgi:alpha-1,3-rhamnosyl/mannosyltransferase